MKTLQELLKNRKQQLEARNGTTELQKNLTILKSLNGTERQSFAERMKGYIEALYDNHIMTFQDAKDWEKIVESNM